MRFNSLLGSSSNSFHPMSSVSSMERSVLYPWETYSSRRRQQTWRTACRSRLKLLPPAPPSALWPLCLGRRLQTAGSWWPSGLSESFPHRYPCPSNGTGRENVDGRGNVLPVELPAQNDLAFRDVPGQVGDGMGLVILGHGENGDHGDGTRFALLPSGPFVQGGEVCIHIAGIATASGTSFRAADTSRRASA